MCHYTAIVAEDEELLLNNLISKIENFNLGFQVVAKAQTGNDAWALIKEHNPDLVVTDIKMPVMDGIRLLEKTRQHYPLTSFIITSGFSDFEYTKRAIHLKVSEYLLKPIDPAELYQALLNIRKTFEIAQEEYSKVFYSEMSLHSPEAIAKTLKDYLIHNYAIDINLNLIAANMNYSSSYLTKVFQQYYSTTPMKYITNLRISSAKQLLRSSDLSIRQISETVGYNDQGYFSRIFKKHTGLSPFEFREQCHAL